MSGHRIHLITARVLRQFRRDHRSVGMLFVVPLLIMTLLTLVIEIGDDTIRVGVAAEGVTALLSGSLAGYLDAQDNVDGINYDTIAEGQEVLARHELDALLVLRADFIGERITGKKATIEVHLSEANPSRVGSVLKDIRDATNGMLDAMPSLVPASCSDECVDGINTTSPELDIIPAFGPEEASIIDYHASFFVTYFAFFFTFLFCSLALFRERTEGTLERLLTSTVTPIEVYFGYLIAYFILGMIQSSIILYFMVEVLDVYIAGNPWLALVAMAPTVLIAEATGMFVSGLSHREFQIVQFIPVVIIPQALLSNLFWPVSEFPVILKVMAMTMPAYWADAAVHVVFFEGKGFAAMLPALGVLVGMSLLLTTFTARLIGRQG